MLSGLSAFQCFSDPSGQRVAMRQGDVVYYIHTDHLGSVSVLSDGSGHEVPGSAVRYLPYGGLRLGEASTLPTDYGFTGQRLDAGTGLYQMGARWYDPALGRWIQADTIVPEHRDPQATQWLLRVGVSKPQDIARVGEENRQTAQYGFWFQRGPEARQKTVHPTGPTNPQELNRYAYCLGNPLRYVDPTGHDGIPLWRQTVATMLSIGATALDITCLGLSTAGVILEIVGFAGGLGSGLLVEPFEPSPGGGVIAGEVTGVAVAIALYQPLNAMENRLGMVSLLLTASADALSGLTYPRQTEIFPDVAAAELVVGQDTVVIGALASLGYVPEPILDFAINLTMVGYDIGRLGGRIPTYFHGVVGVTESGVWYQKVEREDHP